MIRSGMIAVGLMGAFLAQGLAEEGLLGQAWEGQEREPAPLRILTYNVYLKPSGLCTVDDVASLIPGVASNVGSPDVAGRARAIPRFLNAAGESPYDAIVFCETFDNAAREVLLSGLAARYPHRTKVVGTDGLLGQDGGVILVSPWKITVESQEVFRDTTGADACAQKGVVYARIERPDGPFHVFGTHLQAGAAPACQTVRQAQLQQMARFMASMRLPTWEPVIIAGDMNVDRHRFPNEHARMMEVLAAREPQGDFAQSFSFDPDTNPLARRDGTPHREYLDYVLCSGAHLQPNRSQSKVLVPHVGEDLSDHYPVEGTFHFAGDEGLLTPERREAFKQWMKERVDDLSKLKRFLPGRGKGRY